MWNNLGCDDNFVVGMFNYTMPNEVYSIILILKIGTLQVLFIVNFNFPSYPHSHSQSQTMKTPKTHTHTHTCVLVTMYTHKHTYDALICKLKRYNANGCTIWHPYVSDKTCRHCCTW